MYECIPKYINKPATEHLYNVTCMYAFRADHFGVEQSVGVLFPGETISQPHSRPQLPVVHAVLWASPATCSQSGQLSPAQLGLDVATGPAAKRGKWPILV